MSKVIYTLNVTLDGYVETPDKSLDWGVVDDELHQWFNGEMRTLDASLYGRGLYETMSAYWPTAKSDPDATTAMLEYADIWLNTPRIVFSKSLDHVDFNSRLSRENIVDALPAIKEEFPGNLEVGGATLAGSLIKQGLVDEFRMVLHPVAIGAGTPYFPPLTSQIPMRLVETKRFQSGVVFLRYEAAYSGRQEE
jgi:dihydrofolate reductase